MRTIVVLPEKPDVTLITQAREKRGSVVIVNPLTPNAQHATCFAIGQHRTGKEKR